MDLVPSGYGANDDNAHVDVLCDVTCSYMTHTTVDFHNLMDSGYKVIILMFYFSFLFSNKCFNSLFLVTSVSLFMPRVLCIKVVEAFWTLRPASSPNFNTAACCNALNST